MGIDGWGDVARLLTAVVGWLAMVLALFWGLMRFFRPVAENAANAAGERLYGRIKGNDFRDLDRRFDQIDKRFERAARQMDQQFEQMGQQVGQRFEQVTRQMDLRFKQMDTKSYLFVSVLLTGFADPVPAV